MVFIPPKMIQQALTHPQGAFLGATLEHAALHETNGFALVPQVRGWTIGRY